jgi:hypothetical protein
VPEWLQTGTFANFHLRCQYQFSRLWKIIVLGHLPLHLPCVGSIGKFRINVRYYFIQKNSFPTAVFPMQTLLTILFEIMQGSAVSGDFRFQPFNLPVLCILGWAGVPVVNGIIFIAITAFYCIIAIKATD